MTDFPKNVLDYAREKGYVISTKIKETKRLYPFDRKFYRYNIHIELHNGLTFSLFKMSGWDLEDEKYHGYTEIAVINANGLLDLGYDSVAVIKDSKVLGLLKKLETLDISPIATHLPIRIEED